MQRLKFQEEQRSTTFKGRLKRAIRDLTGYEVSLSRYTPPSPGFRADEVLAMLDLQARPHAIQLDYGIFDPTRSELHVTHLAGLYSCISVTLWMLADLLSEGHVTRKINYTHTLDSYRDSMGQDLYPALFAADVDEDGMNELGRVSRSEWSRFDHHGEYRKLPLQTLNSLIALYFRPSRQVAERTIAIRDRHLQPDKRYLGVCFRGTDKGTEVMPIDSAVYLDLAERLLAEKRADRILIQTDQEQVSHLFKRHFGPSCDLIDKLPRTRGMVAIHNETAIDGSRLEFAQDMMAAVTLLARMQEVIVYTGNVGVWVVLLRGSTEGVWQATPSGIFPQWPQAAA